MKAGVAFTMRGNAARGRGGVWCMKNSPLSHQETNWESFHASSLVQRVRDAFCSLALGEEFKILACYLNGIKMRSRHWETLIIAAMRRKETNFQGNEALAHYPNIGATRISRSKAEIITSYESAASTEKSWCVLCFVCGYTFINDGPWGAFFLWVTSNHVIHYARRRVLVRPRKKGEKTNFLIIIMVIIFRASTNSSVCQ